jgi:hypothetical protein
VDYRYGSVKQELEKAFPGVPVIAEDMPDPFDAKESIWHPFILQKLGCDERTLVIGHSSGAACLQRLVVPLSSLMANIDCCSVDCWKSKSSKALLLSRATTPTWAMKASAELTLRSLPWPSEEAVSGYFSRPWKWDSIKANAGFIMQFGSEDGKRLTPSKVRTLLTRCRSSSPLGRTAICPTSHAVRASHF